MKRIPFEELIDDSAVVERISGSCFAVALCLFDKMCIRDRTTYGKRKDLIYEIGVYHNYQLVFQTELRIPLGYEKKTGQAIALALKQFGLRCV